MLSLLNALVCVTCGNKLCKKRTASLWSHLISVYKAMILTGRGFGRVYCHGMTKSVKVHRKDQSVNKNAILASFMCFFNFPDRNLLILYKITWKLPFCVRYISCPFLESTPCARISCLCLTIARISDFYLFLLFLFMPLLWPDKMM